MRPLCFVLMPFGRKADESGRLVDFDAVYRQIIAPAVDAAGIEPIRADEEQVGGTIHKPMFERLILCDFAVADLTGANPNVYYELGVRHAIRPRSTIILFSETCRLAFDVAPLRGIPYRLDEAGLPSDTDASKGIIAERLRAMREDHSDDSPVFQLIPDMPRIALVPETADVFRRQVEHSQSLRNRVLDARSAGAAAVRGLADDPEFSALDTMPAGVVVEFFMALRAIEAFELMVDVHARMPPPLRRARMVQEQYGLALNRLGRRDEAERVLKAVIAKHGVNSETNGLLGRVYKDRARDAEEAGDSRRAQGWLRQAVAAYLAGFEADWRDPYPGVNALTLMETLDKPDPRQAVIAPVVYYAALRRAERGDAEYWDQATLLELALLARDRDKAEDALERTLAAADQEGSKIFELRSTAGNLKRLRERRATAGEDTEWAASIETALIDAALRMGRANDPP